MAPKAKPANLEDGFAEVIYHKVSPDDKGLHLRDVINEVIRSIKSYIEANQLTVDDTVQKLLSAFLRRKAPKVATHVSSSGFGSAYAIRSDDTSRGGSFFTLNTIFY